MGNESHFLLRHVHKSHHLPTLASVCLVTVPISGLTASWNTEENIQFSILCLLKQERCLLNFHDTNCQVWWESFSSGCSWKVVLTFLHQSVGLVGVGSLSVYVSTQTLKPAAARWKAVSSNLTSCVVKVQQTTYLC